MSNDTGCGLQLLLFIVVSGVVWYFTEFALGIAVGFIAMLVFGEFWSIYHQKATIPDSS